MSIKRYICKKCFWTFELDMWTSADDLKPKYCPVCGEKWITKKTPIQIVEEIKSNCPLGYCCKNLLNELKEMAEGREK